MSPTRRAILRTSAAAVAALTLPAAAGATAPPVTIGQVDTTDMRLVGFYGGFSDNKQGYHFPVAINLYDAGDGTHVLEYQHTSSFYHEASRKWVTIHHSTRTATVTGPIDLGRLNAIVHELVVAAGGMPVRACDGERGAR